MAKKKNRSHRIALKPPRGQWGRGYWNSFATDLDEELDEIFQAAEDAGMSLAQLAIKAGLCYDTVVRLKNRQSYPFRGTVWKHGRAVKRKQIWIKL